MSQTRVSPEPSAVAGNLTRAAYRDALAELLNEAGIAWAWQGPRGAPEIWDDADGPADLDIWWRPVPAGGGAVLEMLRGVAPLAIVAKSDDPRRLRHLSAAVEIGGRLAVVDFTEGDLRVGPVLMVPADEVQLDQTEPLGPRLAGVAGAADLLLRPLLRGKVPPAARLAEARTRWAEASGDERATATGRWQAELGTDARQVVSVLEGFEPGPDLARRVRLRLLRRTVAPSGLKAAWAQRWSVVPAGSSAGPLDLRTRGVVVALVGTDGSGKSTVGRQASERLSALGYGTAEAYFGMARGNLPGVSLARRVLGIKAEPAEHQAPRAPEPAADAGPAPEHSAEPDLSHPTVRRAAAWFYAVEYAWRYARHVAPAVRRREVVICDRYVYDLRDSPWPGSPAARFAQRIVPAPDVLVLPDAPVELIHARKPERTLASQKAQQSAFHVLLAEHPARCAEIVVDTSGDDPDPVAPLVAAVVQASHRPRGAPRA